MKICIIAEGSYPYVTGGVSSWIQMLVKSMPEHEFIIYSIGALEEARGKFRYELPENITEVKESFLDSYLTQKGKWGTRLHIDEAERLAITGIITGEIFSWETLFRFVEKNRTISVSDILMSKDFYDIILQISEKHYPYVVFNDFFWTVRSMLLTILEVIRNGIPKADLYHSVSTGYAGVLASLGKYTYESPFILTEHGIYTREREEEIIKADWVKGYFKDNWIRYFYSLSRCAYEYSDRVVTLFNRNKEIQIELGCLAEKITVIPNGINYNDFITLNKDREGMKDEINVGAVLRVVPIKDVKTIIQGFASACDTVKNMRMYIMGPEEEDKGYADECKALAASLQLDNITFTGQVNIKEYIGKMDILLLGSISEGQPLAVLEGMAAGKPHIVTDVGSCRELMYGTEDDFGDAGIVVPVMDYEAMGDAIVKLSRSKELRAKMGQNAIKRVSELYTLDSFINSYKKMYEDLKKVKEGVC